MKIDDELEDLELDDLEGGTNKMMYKYKKCARCGRYNGTTMKLCTDCRKYMRKMMKGGKR